MPVRTPGQNRDGPSREATSTTSSDGGSHAIGGGKPASAPDGEAVDGNGRAAEGGLDGEEGGFEGEEGGGADGQAAVGLLEGSGGPQRGGRVHPARQPLEGPRLVRVHQRRPGDPGTARGLPTGDPGAVSGRP